MHAILVILAMSGDPCDSWFERFFMIECAVRSPRIVHEREIRRHDTDHPDAHAPGRDGGGDDSGSPPDRGGSQPPDTPATPPDNGGGPPQPGNDGGDANKGHGNDPGRHDPDNPGRGQAKGRR